MAAPDKYKILGGFHKYYKGVENAPCMTLFVGGNHEASGYNRELHLGGWVAKNIYFMGYSNVLKYKGLKIGGISGIYMQHNYNNNYNETPAMFGKNSMHHVRKFEVEKLKQYRGDLDIFVSHDWPTLITDKRNGEKELATLLKIKPYFKQDIKKGELGSPVSNDILERLRPAWWFSSHLHVRHRVNVNWSGSSVEKNKDEINVSDSENENADKPYQMPQRKKTRFLALDKCLPGRKYLEIIDFELDEHTDVVDTLQYDTEWLAILKTLQKHIPSGDQILGKDLDPEAEKFWNNIGSDVMREIATEKDKLEQNSVSLMVPDNFSMIAPAVDGDFNENSRIPRGYAQRPYRESNMVGRPNTDSHLLGGGASKFYHNPQTELFCSKFDIPDIFKDY
ncbi:Lariat debranching enzyme [Zancudomyces culisetae]|uniref:Lariat debranching enzyme n=1 Tax=Zancudomyces culisetae TaxID=1213189 RepID=A0A1R1PQX3_ZANCU|nr:Lariat debranching enzyme [Zancudomyces culisetae]OMH83354.1 Lariat debranching enzyme [Zancudomyces culisetae]|eukprot:OMH78663.1 Lariat debranching enzyme [Zancudomyces culisetae]